MKSLSSFFSKGLLENIITRKRWDVLINTKVKTPRQNCGPCPHCFLHPLQAIRLCPDPRDLNSTHIVTQKSPRKGEVQQTRVAINLILRRKWFFLEDFTNQMPISPPQFGELGLLLSLSQADFQLLLVRFVMYQWHMAVVPDMGDQLSTWCPSFGFIALVGFASV